MDKRTNGHKFGGLGVNKRIGFDFLQGYREGVDNSVLCCIHLLNFKRMLYLIPVMK